MKKLFTSAALALAALSAQATDYTDMLNVSVNGMAMPEQETTVSIDQNADNTYKLSLKNLTLVIAGVPMAVGNIVLDNVAGIQNGEVTTLQANQAIQITPGDESGLTWIGPGLGNVPIDMIAEIRSNSLYFNIDIDMSATAISQVINVRFGDGGYQIKNSGFEDFHTATYVDGDKSYSSEEPNAWHSFNSGVASGTMAVLTKLALQNGNTSVSDIVRPGSTGSKSVAIKSSMVLGFQPANGTMTTGRLQAGSLTATDPANCSFMDMSKTDVDGNGDPFYTVLNGTPDSLAVWVKFKQGAISEDNSQYKYATVSAIITDGTYYQDPEDKEYTNILAKAQNKQIESKDFQWQRLSIPFDYETYAANAAEGKALLVTISTNAQPGVGSSDANNPDSIIVDDIELIYNSTVTGISVKGTPIADFDAATKEYNVGIEGDLADITADDIEVTTNGRGTKVMVDVADVDCEGVGSVANITVYSCDLKTKSQYVVKTFTQGYIDGISNVNADNGEVEAVYNLNGQRVESPVKGQVYITKYANGKTVKTVKK